MRSVSSCSCKCKMRVGYRAQHELNVPYYVSSDPIYAPPRFNSRPLLYNSLENRLRCLGGCPVSGWAEYYA